MLEHSPDRESLATSRLVLRPSAAEDAERAFVIRSDWEVARMLSRASFPPDLAALGDWFADHRAEWERGSAYRFAVLRDGVMIGLVDLDGLRGGEGELGYWFDRAYWRQGYASEAAERLTRFAFERLGLAALRAGHAADNEASGAVLRKLGFQFVETVQRFSQSRAEEVAQCRYRLLRGAVTRE